MRTLVAVPESQRWGSWASSEMQKSRKRALLGRLLRSEASELRSVVGIHLPRTGGSISSEVLPSRMAKSRSALGSKAAG